MPPKSQPRWIGAGLVLLGVAGVSTAVTAVLAALPAPAAGGTCGPGAGSESAIAAFLNPGSIGAGAEPSTVNVAAHAQWLAFVGECQAATSSRVLGAFAILVLSVGVVIAGLLLSRRGARKRDASGGPDVQPPSSNPPSETGMWWESEPLGSGSRPSASGSPFAGPPTDAVPAGDRPAALPAGDPPTAALPSGGPQPGAPAGSDQRISTSSR